MARRRQPQTIQTFIISIVGALAIAIIGYHARLAILENFAEKQITHTQEVMARLQTQQLEQQRQMQAEQQQAKQAKREAMERDAENMHRIAEESRMKDEAWNSFFHQSKDCDIWRDDRHMVECQNKVIRAKGEFEKRWAAGEFRIRNL
ncbi:hypothetical protein [Pseudomonas sp. WAC2]|uniref:hypothetical protein n=1 Tax=Pseudomonas sp. WAC2 TaxID=3055057 RepID=UPI0025B15EFD|nr:hypothetical protein [Pseudomonas sp. WAC2]MDN3234527.1 hypothetical protein [Pseudomonas sp. WAC2]